MRFMSYLLESIPVVGKMLGAAVGDVLGFDVGEEVGTDWNKIKEICILVLKNKFII